MVTSATFGCSSQWAEHLLEHARGRRLADRDRAGQPDHERRARRLRPVQELLLLAVQAPGGLDPQAEQPREREVDLLHLLEVELVAEPAQPGDLSVDSGWWKCSPSAAHAARSSSTYGDGSTPFPAHRWAWRALFQYASGRSVARVARAPPIDSRPMCGIVGYVGEKQAQDVVIEGLRRLEYRGYDSAGIALVADGHGSRGRKRAGKLANLEKALADDAAARRPRPASATPAGPPTARPTTSTPTPTSATRAGSRWCTTGSSRTSPTLRAEVEAAGDELLSETDTEIAAHLLETGAGRRRRPDRRDAARSAGGSRARSRWSPSTPRTRRASSRPGVTPRWSSGSARARTSSAPTSRRSSSTPARRWSSGRTRSSRSPATASSVIGFDGTPAEGNRYHVDWDLSAAEKDGYDWFMRKEIFEQPRAIARRAARPPRRRRAAAARRGADLRRRAARGRQDHHHRLRHGVLRRPGREVRHRALDPHPVRGRAGPRVPLPRPDPDPVDAGGRDQPVRRDRRHPDGDPARAAAALEGAGDLQHQRLDDPARVRRGDLHPRRARDRRRVDQGLHHPGDRGLPARALPRAGQAARRTATRSRGWSPSSATCPATCSGSSTTPTSSTRWPRSSRTRSRCSSSGGTSASRSRSRAR